MSLRHGALAQEFSKLGLIGAVFAAAIATGVVIRLTGLTIDSLWWDELFIPQRFANPDFGLAELAHHWRTENTPPLYYILIWLWQMAFGSSDAALRSFGVMVSLMSIVAIVFARKGPLTLTKRVIFAGLMAVSFAAVYYSHEVRAYCLLYALATVLLLTTLRITEALPRDADIPLTAWISFAVLGIACAYTHYFGLLFAGGCTGAIVLGAMGIGRWRPAGVAALIGIVTVLSLVPYIAMRADAGIGEGNASYSADFSFLIAHTAIAFLRLGGHVVFAGLLAGLMVIAVIVFALRIDWRAQPSAPLSPARALLAPEAVCIIAATSVIVAGLAISFAVVPIYYFRNVLVVMPAALLLAALGADHALSWVTSRTNATVAAGLAVLVLGGGIVLTFHDYWRPSKTPWREAARLINQQAACRGQSVLVFGEYPDFYQHYLDPSADVSVTAFGRSDYTLIPFGENNGGAVVLSPQLDTVNFSELAKLAADSTCPVKVWVAGAAPLRDQDAHRMASAFGGDSWNIRRMRGIVLLVDEDG